MKKNMGKIDKIIRIVAGSLIIAWGLTNNNWWGLIGVLPLLTGLIDYCPLYMILGIDSCGYK